MKIIKDNFTERVEKNVSIQVCYWCKSELQLDSNDIFQGTMVYSQREIDTYVPGFTCPCCGRFSAIKK